MAIIYGVLDAVRMIEKLPYISSKKSPKHRGKKGELKALDKLSELDNNYHIICGIRINLRYSKARPDFVVISKRGIVSIEVKYWSKEYLHKEQAYRKKYGGNSPHYQADNSGKVLWTILKRSTSLNNPPVTKVLLATNGNFQEDSQYRFVNVKDLKNINSFIQTRAEKLSDEQIQSIIEFLIEDRYIPDCMINYSLSTRRHTLLY